MLLMLLMPLVIAYLILGGVWLQMVNRYREFGGALAALTGGLLSHAVAWVALVGLSAGGGRGHGQEWWAVPLAYASGQLLLLLSSLLQWLAPRNSHDQPHDQPGGWGGLCALCCLALCVPPAAVIWFMSNFRMGGI